MMKTTTLWTTMLIACLFFGTAQATVNITYTGVPSPTTELQPGDTFTVRLHLDGAGGELISGINGKFEVVPGGLAEPTSITAVDSATIFQETTDNNRVTAIYTAGGGQNSIEVADVEFTVVQFPQVADALLKFNPISMSVNTSPVTEYWDIRETCYPLLFRVVDPPEDPDDDDDDNQNVGEDSFELPSSDGNDSSTSTGIAGCAASARDSQAGFILLLLTSLILFFKRQNVLPIVIFAIVLTLPNQAEARRYWVDPSHPAACNGSGCPGDQFEPFDSLQAAFSIGRLFEPGDMVYVRNNTYNEGSVDVTPQVHGNGRYYIPIMIEGESSGGTVVNGGTGPAMILRQLVTHYQIRNFHFQNGGQFEFAPGLYSQPATLALVQVGPGMTVEDNVFSGTVANGVNGGKSALHITNVFQAPTNIFEGHLVRRNSFSNMGLSDGASYIFLVDTDYSFVENNTIIHTNANVNTAPFSGISVTGSSRVAIRRNAVLNTVRRGNTAASTITLSGAFQNSIHNNYIGLWMSSSGGSSSSDEFMAPFLIIGSGSASGMNPVFNNTISARADSTADNRSTAILAFDYGDSRAYSDFINNVVVAHTSGAAEPQFLWTGDYRDTPPTQDDTRHSVNANSIDSYFYSVLPDGNANTVTTLHARIDDPADFGVSCFQISSGMTPYCNFRNYVGFGQPIYDPFQDWFAQQPPFVDDNFSLGFDPISGANGSPFDPAQYEITSFPSPLNQGTTASRCSNLEGETGQPCDNLMGADGGAAELQYGQSDTITLCGPNNTEVLDVHPTTDPDRRLSVADVVQLVNLGRNTEANNVATYLTDFDTTHVDCP